jgi:DNA-3-methyladenine glycosylase II
MTQLPVRVSESTLVDSPPAYWAQACRHLSAKDRVMKKLILAHPKMVLQSRGDAFATLARSIVGQQISVKAAQSVWLRFVALAGDVTPARVLLLAPDDMRAAGLSARKVEYLNALSAEFSQGGLSNIEWAAAGDEDIIRQLVAVRGVGRWTAEMFLIFHLQRPNVLPLDDVGLINGISRVYYSGEPVSRSDVRELASAWAPYATVATWYIWRSLEAAPVMH